MFCHNCGNRLPDDATFCQSCGERQKKAGNTPPVESIIQPTAPFGITGSGGLTETGKVPIVQGTPQASAVPGVQGTASSPNSPPPWQPPSQNAAPSASTSSAPLQGPSTHGLSTTPFSHHSGSEPAYTQQQIPHTHHSHPGHHHRHTGSNGLKHVGRLSRRAVLGLVGATTVVIAGGGLALGVISRHLRLPSTGSSPAPEHPAIPNFPPVGTTLLTYRGHSDRGLVADVAWSPDGTRIASIPDVGSVKVWNATNGNTLLTYGSLESFNVAWSPDGTRIASSNAGDQVEVWNAITGKTIVTYRGHSICVNAVAWSHDNKFIASASGCDNSARIIDNTVQVWDTATSNTLFTYNGHSSYVFDVAWSPDGKHIASSASGDGTVQVWDAMTGGDVHTYHVRYGGRSAWSPDSKRIASIGDDPTVHVWDAATGNTFFIYRGHSFEVFAVAWSPDGTRIASCGNDLTVKVWQAV